MSSPLMSGWDWRMEFQNKSSTKGYCYTNICDADNAAEVMGEIILEKVQPIINNLVYEVAELKAELHMRHEKESLKGNFIAELNRL